MTWKPFEPEDHGREVAALVAQVESLTRERDDAREAMQLGMDGAYDTGLKLLKEKDAECERLTRERDEARACPMLKCPYEEQCERLRGLLSEWHTYFYDETGNVIAPVEETEEALKCDFPK